MARSCPAPAPPGSRSNRSHDDAHSPVTVFAATSQNSAPGPPPRRWSTPLSTAGLRPCRRARGTVPRRAAAPSPRTPGSRRRSRRAGGREAGTGGPPWPAPRRPRPRRAATQTACQAVESGFSRRVVTAPIASAPMQPAMTRTSATATVHENADDTVGAIVSRQAAATPAMRCRPARRRTCVPPRQNHLLSNGETTGGGSTAAPVCATSASYWNERRAITHISSSTANGRASAAHSGR